jgi:drug/metabolite transporter (DMT)-like permease
VRAAALILALSAAAAWTVGGVLLKKGTDVVSPATILIFQYVAGVVAISVYLLATSGVGATLAAAERQWLRLLVLAACQIGGYVCFVVAVGHAGKGSLPTAAVLAIAATYPAFVAVVSGPFLGEQLDWHQALGVALIVAGVIVTLVG